LLYGTFASDAERARAGIVTVDGADYLIVDIGCRMLEPEELKLAQGFPRDYIIAFDLHGKPLPKHAQVRMVGNSVCPQVASAVIRVNQAVAPTWTAEEHMQAA
jgi:DNA (cytosine-5)-methyltransferase 1